MILPAVQQFQQVPAKYEGQRVNGCGTRQGLTRCFTHVSGGVTAKMDALPHCICDDFFSAIAIMCVYECIPPENKIMLPDKKHKNGSH
jgi:hypothetical protein